MKLDNRELAAVLGGLRALQNVQQHEALAPELQDVVTSGGTVKPLDDGEIDALCERLNGPDPDYETAWRAYQDKLGWMQGHPDLNAHLGRHFGDVANDLIEAAHPGMRARANTAEARRRRSAEVCGND